MNLQQILQLDFEKLKKNPVRHREVLYRFRDIVKEQMLGVEDAQWRGELEFLLERTNGKIKEVSDIVNTKRKDLRS